MIGSTEHLYCLIVAAGGKRPAAAGMSEDDLRELLRDTIEVKLEADDPVAAYDKAEREAWKAVKFPKPTKPTKTIWEYAVKEPNANNS